MKVLSFIDTENLPFLNEILPPFKDPIVLPDASQGDSAASVERCVRDQYVHWTSLLRNAVVAVGRLQ